MVTVLAIIGLGGLGIILLYIVFCGNTVAERGADPAIPDYCNDLDAMRQAEDQILRKMMRQADEQMLLRQIQAKGVQWPENRKSRRWCQGRWKDRNAAKGE